MAVTYHGAVPVPGQERHIAIGPYDSTPELAGGFGRVARLLRDQGFMSPGDRFRFYGHVEEDGVSRHLTPTEEAALGDAIDRELEAAGDHGEDEDVE